jgi:hypothetical protein
VGLLTEVDSFPIGASGIGQEVLFLQLVVAESKFLDDMVDDLGIFGREIQDLETGIIHIWDNVRFAPLAVN